MDHFGRTKFQWEVTLQARSGELSKVPFSSHWSPSHEGTMDAINKCASIEMGTATKKEYVPIGDPVLQ